MVQKTVAGIYDYCHILSIFVFCYKICKMKIFIIYGNGYRFSL